MRFQAISRDDYGQTAIIGTHDTIEGAISQCRDEVTNLNFSNALTTDNKFRSIEAFMVDIINGAGDVEGDVVYMGDMTAGQHQALNVKTGEKSTIDDTTKLRIYIGRNEKEDFYLENFKGEPVATLKDENLQDKTYFFVKGV